MQLHNALSVSSFAHKYNRNRIPRSDYLIIPIHLKPATGTPDISVHHSFCHIDTQFRRQNPLICIEDLGTYRIEGNANINVRMKNL